MNLMPSSRAPLIAALGAVLLGLTALAVVPASLRAGESRAQVRLVRLLDEVPDSDRAALGQLHDLRLRLEEGNILLLRKHGEFAAILPIEGARGGKDSLRYFYYVEYPSFLWVFPGQRNKGIATVPDGGSLAFNTFELRWRASGRGLGWIYFPMNDANKNVSFSVVSGSTVDEADPMDTKYWIELGPADVSGF
jgi:hypothetical protein